MDIPSGILHSQHHGRHEQRFVRADLSAVALAGHGSLVAAVRGGLAHLDADELRFFARIEPEIPHRRLNDIGVDPAGRLWAGCVDDTGRPGSTLYRVDRTGTHPMLAVDYANGLAWSPDGTTMYIVDSLRHTVSAHDYDVPRGEPAFRDLVWQGTARDGIPDGLAVDQAGDLWVAFWGAGCLRRLSPDGTVRQTVELPALKVSSCAFGGAQLDTLYVTSAADDTALSGAVFSLPVQTPGLPVPAFSLERNLP